VPARIRERLDGQSVIWVHAVSVGEVLAASRLIEELGPRLSGVTGRRETSAWRVMISTTTRTGQELARKRFGADRVFYFRWIWAGLCGRGSRQCVPGWWFWSRRSLAAHAGRVPEKGKQGSGGRGERPYLPIARAALSAIRMDVALSVARVGGGFWRRPIWMRNGCALWARTMCE